MKKGKGRKRIKFIVYNFIVVTLLLGGVEWYLNAKLNNPESVPDWLYPALRKYYKEYDCTNIQMHPEMARYDSTLFYTLKPGTFTYSNREFNTSYQVNHLGIRDDDESLNDPKIVVLGDSYSMGWGVEQEETYASLLEKELETKVLNTAISSYGTAREVTSLKKFDTENAEFFIIQYCPNDLRENQQWVYADRSLHVSSQEIYLENRKFHLNQTKYYPFKHLLRIPGLLKSPIPERSLPTAALDSSTLIGANEAFLSILRSSKKIPAHAKIIVFSLEAEKSDDTFISGLKNVLDKQFASSLQDRISFIDLTGKIEKEHRFVLDPHINAKGHRVIASLIKEHLNQLDLSKQEKTWNYDDGNICIRAEYDNGVKNGTFTSYWPNGQVSRICTFVNGSKEGKEKDFSQDGTLIATRYYRNDVLITP